MILFEVINFIYFNVSSFIAVIVIITLSLCLLLQDVSDRIEKDADDADTIISLQKESIAVVRGDWKVHIGHELQQGTL